MPVHRICQNCGKDFFVSPSALKRGGIYCSHHCAASSPMRNAKLGASLKEAWRDPQKRDSWMSGLASRSSNPDWANAAHFQKGASHPRYKGNKRARLTAVGRYHYKKWHRQVLQKDNFTCQSCGQRGGHLVAHHKEPWANNPALRYNVENGIALCVSCHDNVHGRKAKPKTRECAHCGKVFPLKKNRQRFCSLECAGEASKKGDPITCPICGTVFYRSPAFRKTKSGLNFCSSTCKESWYRDQHQ